MSGRYPSPRGWDRPRTPAWVYALVGVLLTAVVVLGIVILMLLGSDDTGLASASATPTRLPGAATPPTSTASAAAVASAAPTPAPTGAPTPEITPEITAQVTSAPAAGGTPAAGGSPAASTKPTLESITLLHKADCAHDYGYGSAGFIQIQWSSSGTTGVRISIDPPSPTTAYEAGYRDEPTASGSDWVPFACDSTFGDSGGSYHLYVVTTLHTTGYYQYRYQKVYELPQPTSTP